MGIKVPGVDPSDDLHAESRGSSKRFLGWLTEIDWAKQLTDALAAPSAAIAATKALPGILRFATNAEAIAGTQDNVGITPPQLLTAVADLLSGGRFGPINRNVSNGNWNNVLTTGFSMGQAMANAPEGGAGWNYVLTQRYSDDYITQAADTFTSDGGSIAQASYWRHRTGGTWNAWQRVASTAALAAVAVGTPTYGANYANFASTYPTTVSKSATHISLSIGAKRTSGTFQFNETVVNLPEGFRPSRLHPVSAPIYSSSAGAWALGVLQVNGNGDVNIIMWTNNTAEAVLASITFPIA